MTEQQPFNLETFKREVCNNPTTASDWLKCHMPEPEKFSLWRGKCNDDVPTLDFVRRNRINGYLALIEKPNAVFAIIRHHAGDIEGLFLIKGADLSVIADISESFALTPETMGALMEAAVTHGGGEFEDYILK